MPNIFSSYFVLYLIFEFCDALFFDSRYVGLRDAEQVGDLFLRHLATAVKPETKPDNQPFALGELVDRFANDAALFKAFELVGNAVLLAAENVRKEQFVAVPVDVERLVDRDLAFRAAALSYIHKYLVFDTARGVGRELDATFGVEGVYRLDKPYRAYRNEILHADPGAFKLFRDIDDEPQIVLDERRAGVFVDVDALEDVGFFLAGKGRRQNIGTVDIEDPAPPAEENFMKKRAYFAEK